MIFTCLKDGWMKLCSDMMLCDFVTLLPVHDANILSIKKLL